MVVVTTAAQAAARSRQIQVHGRDYTIAEYIGAAPTKGIYVEGNELNDNGLPQGFLVTQPAGAVTPPHFHEPNQFQVFVAGHGSIGAHPARAYTVQYANGHTPYGPIVASQEGLIYFTLRQRWDPGAKYLPASRDKLVKGNQRTRVADALVPSTQRDRQARGAPSSEVLMPREADGLAAWIWRAGSRQPVVLPGSTGGGGQYLLVVEGNLVHAGSELGRLSTIYLRNEEPQPAMTSGQDGLDLLVLQFPATDQPLAVRRTAT